MFRQMYRGTLATTGPWQAMVTFQQFIVLADNEGVVDMTPEAISRETTIPLKIITIGIEALEKPDPDSRTPDEEGRRIVKLADNRTWGWRITNYVHYRQLKREEDRKEYHRQYWHKRKLNKTQQLNTAQPIAEAYAEAEANTDELKMEKSRAVRSTAHRLGEDFILTPERFFVAEAENIDPDREFARFKDHWRSASGATSRKLDWDAAWRNWCRKAADFAPVGKKVTPKVKLRTADEVEAEWNAKHARQ